MRYHLLEGSSTRLAWKGASKTMTTTKLMRAITCAVCVTLVAALAAKGPMTMANPRRDVVRVQPGWGGRLNAQTPAAGNAARRTTMNSVHLDDVKLEGFPEVVEVNSLTQTFFAVPTAQEGQVPVEVISAVPAAGVITIQLPLSRENVGRTVVVKKRPAAATNVDITTLTGDALDNGIGASLSGADAGCITLRAVGEPTVGWIATATFGTVTFF
jgi:hypothetical protein